MKRKQIFDFHNAAHYIVPHDHGDGGHHGDDDIDGDDGNILDRYKRAGHCSSADRYNSAHL